MHLTAVCFGYLESGSAIRNLRRHLQNTKREVNNTKNQETQFIKLQILTVMHIKCYYKINKFFFKSMISLN